MPDITMCRGGDCQMKTECYRYLANPSFWQSYFVEPPYSTNEDCEHFWKIESPTKTLKNSLTKLEKNS